MCRLNHGRTHQPILNPSLSSPHSFPKESKRLEGGGGLLYTNGRYSTLVQSQSVNCFGTSCTSADQVFLKTLSEGLGRGEGEISHATTLVHLHNSWTHAGHVPCSHEHVMWAVPEF